MKKRLFVALGATEIAAAAQVYMKKLKINFSQREIDVQWVPSDNWHITLHFLGETAAGKISEIEQHLAEICRQSPVFKLKISNFGAFPDPHEARVVWAGVQRSQALLDLQSAVEASLAPMGFAPEDRDYWPHLTVGRLKNHKNVVDALSPVVRKSLGSLEVKEVRLYESQLVGPYPRYVVIGRHFLGGTSSNGV
jgi:2'-5' RNA ligase